MHKNNPISESLDAAIPAANQDASRTLAGFVECARYSAEFERFQRQQLAAVIEDRSVPVSQHLYAAIAAGMWYGFEAGKHYMMSGEFEKMLKLQDTRDAAKVQ